uniref:Metalloendopeptidase n=1 Tax=Esox americanus TaxID=184450 RepID=D2YYG6_ESOAM|nr:hatching enzyme [Esox americanus]
MELTTSLNLLVLLGLARALPTRAEHPKAMDYTERILTANSDSDEILMEGDLVIPRTRSAMVCRQGENNCLWRRNSDGQVVVPYILEDNRFSPSDRQKIKSALLSFQDLTCIRFVPRGNEKDYISYESQRGCFSTLGRAGGRQTVSLNSAGCITNGIIQHETLHALGFEHEHTRSDRDQYVSISWSNIDPRDTSNFNKQLANNLDTPYDYSSVMHYGKMAFSINGQETITTIPDHNMPIGQTVQMSDIDILTINKLYNCSQ